jgi:hypothetical protein
MCRTPLLPLNVDLHFYLILELTTIIVSAIAVGLFFFRDLKAGCLQIHASFIEIFGNVFSNA